MELVGAATHAPVASTSEQLADPSNETCCPARMLPLGMNVNTAFGVLAGGRIVPCGTSRISTVAVCACDALFVVGVAVTWTQLPMTTAVIGDGWHEPALVPGSGAGGDVNVT